MCSKLTKKHQNVIANFENILLIFLVILLLTLKK